MYMSLTKLPIVIMSHTVYTTLTLICLQHCLHYAPYNGAATSDITSIQIGHKTV